jgi:hypothetical protein
MTDTTTTIPATVDTYFAAWNETDPARRRALLEQTWVPEGVYTDPLSFVTGLDEIDTMVAGVQQQFPGHPFSLLSGVDAHHDRIRFEWRLADPQATPVMDGIDVVELAEDGRFRRLSGFIGTRPA